MIKRLAVKMSPGSDGFHHARQKQRWAGSGHLHQHPQSSCYPVAVKVKAECFWKPVHVHSAEDTGSLRLMTELTQSLHRLPAGRLLLQEPPGRQTPGEMLLRH